MTWFFVVAFVLVLLGLFSLRRSQTLYQESGLPAGRLVYVDEIDDAWQINDRPLYSPTYRLTGKPDYLVETVNGLVPVEIKSAKAPPVPYVGHLLQVAAYCLLVEEDTGRSPPHGWLKYADALFEVDFSSELRRELLDTMAEMRQSYQAKRVRRSHNQPNKCRACGFYEACDEALE